MARVTSADEARRILDQDRCPTCGSTRFVREAELAAHGGGFALRYQTCATCGAAREVYLPVSEDIERRLTFVRPYDPKPLEAIAPYVVKGWPEFASPEEQRWGGAKTDTSGVSAGAAWQLVTWLRGSTGFGQGRFSRRDGTSALVTFTRPQRVPAAELATQLARTTEGIAPLLSIEEIGERMVMREWEPTGIALSTPMFPLPPEVALGVLGGIVEILERAAGAGEVLGGIRPELVYAGPDLEVTGIAPRAELLARTMRESRDLAPELPFAALYAAPEAITQGAFSEAGDVFSACAVFLYALTRRAPFAPGGSPMEQVMAMMQGAAVVPGSVPPPLATLIAAGLSPTPGARPTARDLLAALRTHGFARSASSLVYRPATFEEVDQGPVRYQADVDGARWQVKVNALPARRYTLLVNAKVTEELAAWPRAWQRFDDAAQRAEYERELDQVARTRGIAPSTLVK